MNHDKYIKIDETFDVKTNNRGDIFRQVVFRDLQNDKRIKYTLFKDSHNRLWKMLLKGPINNKLLGEIKTIKITDELLRDSGYKIDELSIDIGDEIDILVWWMDGNKSLPEDVRIRWSFSKQVYKYRYKIP